MAARLAALQQYKIKHAALEKMDDLLKNAIDEHTSYSILALYGPSGVGKSTVMKRIAEHCRQEEPDPSVVPVAVVQASPEDVTFLRILFVFLSDNFSRGFLQAA
jgi:Cdc6-like AAA superfamily ATPase